MSTNDVGHTGDVTLLRKVNESAVLELIEGLGPISRVELATRLGLSLPTITRIVTPLIETGLIYQHSAAGSSGGRRPILLSFNYRASLVIGVYIGRNMVGALADLNGGVLHRRSAPSLPGEEGVQALVEFIAALRAEADALSLPVRGVGVGAPSIVIQPEGVIAWAPVLQWRDLPLRERLQTALGLPVVVQNEINLIALGESWRGAGRGIDSLVCISLGGGIGAGLILNGQLFNGSHFAAGEIGYLVPSERFLGRTYDTFGCLESEAGTHGIVRRARRRLEAGEVSRLSAAEPLSAEDVLQAARDGDPVGTAVLSETVDYLTLAIANLAAIVDPQRVVLTGDLVDFGDLFLEAICARIGGLVPFVPEIVLSDLRMDAAVLGAAAMIVKHTSGALFVQASRQG